MLSFGTLILSLAPNMASSSCSMFTDIVSANTLHAYATLHMVGKATALSPNKKARWKMQANPMKRQRGEDWKTYMKNYAIRYSPLSLDALHA